MTAAAFGSAVGGARLGDFVCGVVALLSVQLPLTRHVDQRVDRGDGLFAAARGDGEREPKKMSLRHVFDTIESARR
jgi:hypothetical protein